MRMAPPKEWPITMGGRDEGGNVLLRKARRSAAWVVMVMQDSWEGEGEREVPRKDIA